MKSKFLIFAFSASVIVFACASSNESGNDKFALGQLPQFYSPVPDNVQTRWISPENPTGEKGKGGMTNRGAKGNAFYKG